MIRTGQSGFRALARFLRELRQSRGLSLRAVSSASRSLPRDSGAYISGPYLSLLEGGRPTAVSLPKLLTLAAIYQTSIHQFIAAAPEPLRSALRVQYAQWAETRPVIVDPPPFDDLAAKQAHAHLDDLLAAKVREANLPFDDQDRARAFARGLIVWSALLPAITALTPHERTRFWRQHADQAGGLRLESASSYEAWKTVVSIFKDWLISDAERRARLAALIGWWSADFRALSGSCHFADPQNEALYSYDDAPAGLVVDLRSRQAAAILCTSAPRRLRLPPPPPPADTLRLFLAGLLRPEGVYDQTGHPAASPLSEALSLTRAIVDQLPELTVGAQLSQDRQTAIIGLLRSALGKTT